MKPFKQEIFFKSALEKQVSEVQTWTRVQTRIYHCRLLIHIVFAQDEKNLLHNILYIMVNIISGAGYGLTVHCILKYRILYSLLR